MFSTAFSGAAEPVQAVAEASAALLKSLPDADLVLALACGYDAGELQAPLESLFALWDGRAAVAGGTVTGLVHGTREQEEGPGVVLWGARFPEGAVQAAHLQFVRTEDGGLFTGELRMNRDGPGPADCLLLLIADPYSFPADLMADQMHSDFPGLPIVGGMLSGGDTPRSNLVLVGGKCHRTGCAGIVISGNVPHQVVVSQGSRPIGSPMIVTAADRNELLGLGGQPALERLMQTFRELPAGDQQLVNQGLLLGIAGNEFRESFGYGDFLIRPVIGVVEERHSVVVGDWLRVGKTVQFHVRDHRSAGVDLLQQLELARGRLAPRSAKAGLLFSCNGRGTGLFPEPDHDAAAFCGGDPSMNLAGFFAAGEIGPVGDQSFMHSHTATGVLFG